MEISRTLYVSNRRDWRKWLEENYNTQNEVWLIYYKKHSGKDRIPYDDAVEEALCFGWIDSIIKKIDDERFAQKFTPRKNNNKWSELNIKRMKKMIKEEKMTDAGLNKFDKTLLNNDRDMKVKSSELTVPPYLEEVLKNNEKAFLNFNNLAPTYKKQYILWIGDAKKEETRKKRINEAIELLTDNKKLSMK